MGDTTNIFDLPTDPAGGGGGQNNINLKAMENMNTPSIQNNNSMPAAPQGQLALDQNTINQIVSGLQYASSTGVTQLPSRDIPMTTNAITQDPSIQPNYIPPPQKNDDYIDDDESNDDIINSYNKKTNIQNSLDGLYSEIQTPLLLSILYFLFQLPIFKKNLFVFFPFLFTKDGNFNLYGFLFTSVLFGFVFYFLNKVNTQFGAF
jgi:hypothetical protein